MITLNIGRMDQRVTLQSEQRVAQAGGRATVSFPDIATIWARVETKDYSPVSRGSRTEFPSTVNFTTHYTSALLSARRIVWQTRAYKVVSVSNVDRLQKSLTFKTQEIT